MLNGKNIFKKTSYDKSFGIITVGMREAYWPFGCHFLFKNATEGLKHMTSSQDRDFNVRI